jgi:ribose transport system substrate-binding protein
MIIIKYRLKKMLIHFIMLSAIVLLSLLIFDVILNKPVDKKHLPRKFGATYMTMDNQFFEVLNTSIQDVIVSNGDQFITRDPAQNQEKQNEQILDMLAMKVDLIFINPVDWKKITPALDVCKNADVPYIFVDTDAPSDTDALSVVISDNYEAGVQIGKDIISKRPKAKIALLYNKDIMSMYQRVHGLLDTLNAAAFDYKIVYTCTDTSMLLQSMVVMQQYLDQPMNMKFDVVFGANDPTALGALAALQRGHRSSGILLYDVDGSPSDKIMIHEGCMEGTSAQFPQMMGRTAAENAYNYLEGRKVDKKIIIPVKLITKKNVEDFDMLGWQ